MKFIIGVLTLLLASPVLALDLFSKESASRASSNDTSLEQRVQLLERRINTLSNIVLRLDSLQQEMQQLRGDVEMQNHAMESMRKRQSDLYTDMDQRLSRLAGGVPAGQPAQATGGAVSPGGATATGAMRPQAVPSSGAPSWQSSPINAGSARAAVNSDQARPSSAQARYQDRSRTGGRSLPPVVSSTAPTGVAPGQLNTTTVASVSTQPKPSPAPQYEESQGEKSSYQDAFNLLMDRKYAKAQKSFQAFLKAYPNSRLADNAQYWLAEANYVTRNFDVALTEFTKVVQVFPNSPKISDAILKIGYIQYEKKQWGGARETLSNLANRFPNTTASQLAKKRLDKMQGEGH